MSNYDYQAGERRLDTALRVLWFLLAYLLGFVTALVLFFCVYVYALMQ